MNQELISRAQDEADLCRNEGATDIADLLDELAQALAAQPRRRLSDEEVDDLSREMVKGRKSVNWLCRAVEAKLMGE